MSTDPQVHQNADDGAPGPDKLMTHDYDGIREYDNPTPGWWFAIFLGSVVFSVFYWGVFHMSSLRDDLSLESRHAAATERVETARFELLGELATDDASLMQLSTMSVAIAKGEAIFQAQCALCHTENAGGMQGLGPNLTDDVAKNIKVPGDVYTTISQGVPGTGMQGWEPILGRDDVILAAAYVISLRGTNVEGGLPPEGDPMGVWENPARSAPVDDE